MYTFAIRITIKFITQLANVFFCWLNRIVKYLILLGFFFVVLLILVSVICNNEHIILVVFFNMTLLTLQFYFLASCTYLTFVCY